MSAAELRNLLHRSVLSALAACRVSGEQIAARVVPRLLSSDGSGASDAFARQLLCLALQERPGHIVDALLLSPPRAESKALLADFFCGSPSRIRAWFAHFSPTAAAPTLGALALEHFLLAHRDELWSQLRWLSSSSRRAPPPPGVAAQRRALLCSLDIVHALDNVVAALDFFASDQLRASIADNPGAFLAVDYEHWVSLLLGRGRHFCCTVVARDLFEHAADSNPVPLLGQLLYLLPDGALPELVSVALECCSCNSSAHPNDMCCRMLRLVAAAASDIDEMLLVNALVLHPAEVRRALDEEGALDKAMSTLLEQLLDYHDDGGGERRRKTVLAASIRGFAWFALASATLEQGGDNAAEALCRFSFEHGVLLEQQDGAEGNGGAKEPSRKRPRSGEPPRWRLADDKRSAPFVLAEAPMVLHHNSILSDARRLGLL